MFPRNPRFQLSRRWAKSNRSPWTNHSHKTSQSWPDKKTSETDPRYPTQQESTPCSMCCFSLNDSSIHDRHDNCFRMVKFPAHQTAPRAIVVKHNVADIPMDPKTAKSWHRCNASEMQTSKEKEDQKDRKNLWPNANLEPDSLNLRRRDRLPGRIQCNWECNRKRTKE